MQKNKLLRGKLWWWLFAALNWQTWTFFRRVYGHDFVSVLVFSIWICIFLWLLIFMCVFHLGSILKNLKNCGNWWLCSRLQNRSDQWQSEPYLEAHNIDYATVWQQGMLSWCSAIDITKLGLQSSIYVSCSLACLYMILFFAGYPAYYRVFWF